MRMNRIMVFLVLCGLVKPALASDATGNCDEWAFHSSTAVEAVFVVEASLEILVNGVWVPTGITDTDRAWIDDPAVRTEVDLGAAWPSALGAGHYRVAVTVKKFIGDWADEAEAFAYVEANPNAYAASVVVFSDEFDCLPAFDPMGPCFWKKHPELWPVTTLQLGDDPSAVFDDNCLRQVLCLKRRCDARVRFTQYLIAAKLNVLSGADPSAVVGYPQSSSTLADLIIHADGLLDSSELGCGGFSGPRPRGAERRALKDATAAFKTSFSGGTSCKKRSRRRSCRPRWRWFRRICRR